jgi:hypothetical protein
MTLVTSVSDTALTAFRGCSFANLPWGVAPAAVWFKARFHGSTKTTVNLITCLVDGLGLFRA